MPDPQGFVSLDPSEVEEVATLPPPTAIKPIASHATAADVRASGARPDEGFDPTGLTGVITGVGKRLGQYGYNLGKLATEFRPLGLLEGYVPESVSGWQPVRGAQEEIYGGKLLPGDPRAHQLVNAAWGLEDTPTVKLPPSHVAEGEVEQAPAESYELTKRTDEALAKPTYGPFEDVLATTTRAQKAGALATDIVGGFAINPEMELPAAVEAMVAAGSKGGKIARTLAKVPEAVNQAAVGAVYGGATEQDPLAGAVFGAGTHMLIGGAKTPEAIKAAADRWVESAKVRLGRAIGPTTKANKAAVERHAVDLINEVDWLGTGGLSGFAEKLRDSADKVGAKLGEAMAAAKQGDVSSLLASARRDLKAQVGQLRLQVKKQQIELAPKTAEALEHAADILSSVNPKDTNLTSLRLAHDTINNAVYDIRLEVQNRVRQTRLSWVGDVIDSAIKQGTPQQVRTAMRGTRQGVEDIAGLIEGTRTETQPIIDALETAKDAFRNKNAAGKWVNTVPEAVDHITALQAQIAAYGPEMSADLLWKTKQQWGDVVAGASGRGWYGSIADETRKGALRDATRVMKNTLTDLRPETKPLNERYHALQTGAEIVGDTLQRRTGQTGGLMKSLAVGGGSTVGAGGLLGYMMGALGPVGAGLAGVGAIVPIATTVLKSPEFNLLSAKTRLALAGAVRNGNSAMIHRALQRVTLELMLQNEHSVHGPASGGMDLTDEEYQHELDKLRTTGATTPGITDRPNPDSVYADAPGGPHPLSPDTPEPGILPGSSDADDAMPGDPDYVPGVDGPAVDPQLQARASTALGPRGTTSPEQFRAGLFDDGLMRRGLEFLQRPLIDPASVNIEGHPTLTRAARLASQFTSPLDLAFGAEEIARPIAAGTRFAQPVERAGRAISATMAGAGLQNVEQGLRTGSPSQVVGGATQTLFGGLGARQRGLAGAAEEAGGFLSRAGQGLAGAGKQAIVGPALSLGASQLADSPMMRRMIPDDDKRHAAVIGMETLGLLAGGHAIAAAAYRDMTPSMKAVTHAAGQLSLGRGERLVRHEITPAIEADVRAKFPGWSNEKVAAKVQTMTDAAIAKARGTLQQMHEESGGRALDPRTYERGVSTEHRFFGDWYRGTKDMIREMVPAQEGEAVDANGLTTKQALAVDSLATFGTNTPPKQNFDLYSEAARQINDAPPNLSRDELLQWVEQNKMPRGELFGMNIDKPGIPALRNIVKRVAAGFGGRKIESYGINLAEGTRPDIRGREVIPATVDRWIYRGVGLPTEVPLRTGEPVYRKTPTGEDIPSLQRGGDRTAQKVEALGTDPERLDSEMNRLMAQATARAKARGEAGTGPGVVTAKEIAAIEKLATRNAQQFRVPLQMQATRPTAVGSKWLGQATKGNVSYEVIEQQLKRAGALKGLDVDQAQAMLWYRTKLLQNLTHGEAPEQGLPFTQQRQLAKVHEAAVGAQVDPRLPQYERATQIKKLIDERNAGLVQTLGAKATDPDSGFSHVLATDTDPFGSPLTAVSIYPERQVIVPRSVRASRGHYNTELAAFIRDNADLLEDPNLGVGGWVVKAPTAAERRAGKRPMQFGGREVPEGSLVLDVVALPSNAQNNAIAKSLGMEYLQDSLFDLGAAENVKTGGQSLAKGSPAGMQAAHARRAPIYERLAQALDPGELEGRLSALESDPRQTAQTRRMLQQWREEQAATR